MHDKEIHDVEIEKGSDVLEMENYLISWRFPISKFQFYNYCIKLFCFAYRKAYDCYAFTIRKKKFILVSVG